MREERLIWWTLLFIGLCLMLGSPTLRRPSPMRFVFFDNRTRALLWLLLGYVASLLASAKLFRRAVLPAFALTFLLLILLLLL